MRRHLLMCLACLVVSAGSALAQSPPTTISGEIDLVGCTVPPSQIHVKARPIRPADGPSSLLPADMGVVVARIATPLANGRYPFTLRRLDGRKAYSLTARLQGEQCGTLVWQGPDFVLPGQTDVRIAAMAIRTRIELGDVAADGTPTWVGARAVNLLDAAASNITVRMYSDTPNVQAYRLELSASPFTTSPELAYRQCLSPGLSQALITSTRIESSGGGWVEANVNLHDMVLGNLPGVPPFDENDGSTDGVIVPGTIGTAGGATFTQVVQEITKRQILLGAPVYMRVIPELIGGDLACDPRTDGMSGWAIVSTLGPSPAATAAMGTGDVQVTAFAYTPPKVESYPAGSQRCYRYTEDHVLHAYPQDAASLLDWQWDQLAILGGGKSDGQYMHVGDVFCVSSPDGVDAAVQTSITLVSGAVEAIGLAVTTASKIWQQVKTLVAEVMVAGLTALGADCDATCRALIEGGIDLALAAAGMPPSLPNWEELKAQGLNYVAATIADQAGIPGPVADIVVEKAAAAAEEALNELSHKRGGDGTKLPTWLQYDAGFEPASLVVTLRQQSPGGFLAPRRTLSVTDSVALLGGSAPLPAAFPIENDGPRQLTLPIVLRPNVAGLPSNPTFFGNEVFNDALWNKIQWVQRYRSNPCVDLSFTITETPRYASLGEPVYVPYLFQALLWRPTALLESAGPAVPDFLYDGCTP